jgi:hypothetical protein
MKKRTFSNRNYVVNTGEFVILDNELGDAQISVIVGGI